jgi:hypothetical protein
MSSDDEYTIPLQDQRVFGAGLTKKRVKFVPADQEERTIPQARDGCSDAADRYLSIVMSAGYTLKGSLGSNNASVTAPSEHLTRNDEPSSARCDVCNLPVARPKTIEDMTDSTTSTGAHELSLAHQVCLEHSHPPSHLDRKRHGAKYLSSYGWEPDSRLGLGTNGKGIRHPIKAIQKFDTVGLQMQAAKPKSKRIRPVVERRKLDAGRIRKQTAEDKVREEKLRHLFYGCEDVSRYLHGASE